jgi:hypothetical protein
MSSERVESARPASRAGQSAPALGGAGTAHCNRCRKRACGPARDGEVVEENEPGALSFNYYVDEDGAADRSAEGSGPPPTAS